MSKDYITTTKQTVLEWINLEIFTLKDNQVYKGNNPLTERINLRRGCTHDDPRIDLRHNNKRISINISHFIWMWHTRELIPPQWQIHHRDENPPQQQL